MSGLFGIASVFMWRPRFPHGKEKISTVDRSFKYYPGLIVLVHNFLCIFNKTLNPNLPDFCVIVLANISEFFRLVVLGYNGVFLLAFL